MARRLGLGREDCRANDICLIHSSNGLLLGLFMAQYLILFSVGSGRKADNNTKVCSLISSLPRPSLARPSPNLLTMLPILRSVNVSQATRGVARNYTSYRRRRRIYYESKPRGIGIEIVDVITRGAGATFGWYFGYLLMGHWIPELEEKRQEAMRNAMGQSVKIEDLTEKMWSDAKLIKIFSILEKKVMSKLDASLERMCSDVMEKIGSDPRT